MPSVPAVSSPNRARRVLCAAAAVACWAPAADAAAALAESRCRIEAPRLPAALAMCAELVVPEDRSRPDGRELSLFVARVPALTAAPQPDPLVLIAGGPGQSAVDLYLQMRRAFEPVRRQRDILLLDQRGTGRSADGYECDALTEPEAFDADSQEALRESTQACLRAVERDPRALTSAAAVDDLEALRERLGAERWNLYAISYGTRVAQYYARRFPERVRAMVLDGVVPADLVLGPQVAVDAQSALDAIFARCAAEPACADRYPDLDGRLAALRRRLEAGPVSVEVPDPASGRLTSRVLGEGDVAGAIRLMSYSSPTASLLPLAISEAYEGDYTLIAAQAELLTGDVAAATNMPMHNSVVCTEDVPFFGEDPPAGLDETYLGSSLVDALETICGVWPAESMQPSLRAPLRFGGPVLLLSGGDDPITPPANARRVIAAGLDDAVHLVAPGHGHGIAGIGCAGRLIAEFVAEAEPDAVDGDCLTAEPPMPFFLSPAGPAP